MNSPAACRCWKRSIPATSISAPTSRHRAVVRAGRRRQARLYRGGSRLALGPGHPGRRGIADPDGRRPQGQEGRRHQGRRQSFPAACRARQGRPELQGYFAGLSDPGRRARRLHRRQCRCMGGMGSISHQRPAPVQRTGIVRRQQRACELQALLSVVSGLRRPARRRLECDLRQAR